MRTIIKRSAITLVMVPLATAVFVEAWKVLVEGRQLFYGWSTGDFAALGLFLGVNAMVLGLVLWIFGER